jgi:hypothetical protein
MCWIISDANSGTHIHKNRPTHYVFQSLSHNFYSATFFRQLYRTERTTFLLPSHINKLQRSCHGQIEINKSCSKISFLSHPLWIIKRKKKVERDKLRGGRERKIWLTSVIKAGGQFAKRLFYIGLFIFSPSSRSVVVFTTLFYSTSLITHTHTPKHSYLFIFFAFF